MKLWWIGIILLTDLLCGITSYYFFWIDLRFDCIFKLCIHKGPKGPHIVQLRAMCHIFDGSERRANLFFFSIIHQNTDEFCSTASEEKSKMCPPYKDQGGNLVFPIGPKNTNLVEDVEIMLCDKFRWILFSGFREEDENVSANQRPGQSSCFSDRHEKHKLGRRRWDHAFCQVSLNST